MTAACYVYGIVAADGTIPEGLNGIEGEVRPVYHRKLAAIVGDLARDRSLGSRADLLAHDQVVDSIAAETTIIPMRFAAVVDSETGLVDELLEPFHDKLVASLEGLSGKDQYTLQGEYEHDTVLGEIIAEEAEIRQLREEIVDIGNEAASYPQRLRQGELVVKALEQRRAVDGEYAFETVAPFAVDTSHRELASPDDVINTAFLVDASKQKEFEDAVEKVGRKLAGRVRFRLLGPQPPYDFVPRM